MKQNDEARAAVPAADVESDTGHVAQGAHAGQAFTTPVGIHVHSKRKRECDPDGISAKWAIDAIVKAGILANDTSKEVAYVTFSQEKSGAEETIIEITEL